MRVVRLKYLIKTGIHAGTLKMGFVDKTAYYVMPQVFMGAMINRLTRMFYSCPEPEDFFAVGDFVYQRVKFTPFYVSDGEHTYCPDDSDGKRKWGLKAKIDSDEFEHRFIRSYTGTSINYHVRSARAHTLHETEYIASRDRNGNALFLKGYAIVFPGEYQRVSNSDKRTFTLNEDMACGVNRGENSGHLFYKMGSLLQVGGDRNYGMGLIKCIENESTEEPLFGVVSIEMDGNHPLKISIRKEKAVGLPIKHDSRCSELTNMKGTLSPLIQREYNKIKGFGHHLTHRLFWEPGAYFRTSQERITVKIDDRGFWKIIS
jgi:hypothetical protein